MVHPPPYKYSYKDFSCGQVIKHFASSCHCLLQSKHVLVILNDYTVGRGPRENEGGYVIEMKIHTQRQRSSLNNNKDNKKLKTIMSHIL